jgi:diketogulonate reductase-like aldo/keto reductase
LGQGRHPQGEEEAAQREGVSLGMTLIDTAEIYGNGDAEKVCQNNSCLRLACPRENAQTANRPIKKGTDAPVWKSIGTPVPVVTL